MVLGHFCQITAFMHCRNFDKPLQNHDYCVLLVRETGSEACLSLITLWCCLSRNEVSFAKCCFHSLVYSKTTKIERFAASMAWLSWLSIAFLEAIDELTEFELVCANNFQN